METENMIERDAQEVLVSLGASVERVAAAAAQLEKTIAWLEDRHAAIAGEVHHVVAEVEVPARAAAAINAAYEARTQRETDLERRLEDAENQIVELRAQALKPAPARKTLPAIATSLLAKHGLHGIESIEAGALDAALTGLSLEQRIAVKAQLFRAGALV
jgi:chromosome segregation ATPase